MNRTTTLLLGLSLCLAIAGCAEPPIPMQERVAVVTQDTRFDIAVPQSRVVLQVPRGDLHDVPQPEPRPTENPHYFLLQGGGGLSISGWIEPARTFKPLPDVMAHEFAKFATMGLGKPERVETLRVGAFDAVAYDMTLADGVTGANVRASWHDQDTWIDVHLSRAGQSASAAQLRADVMAALRGLVIQPKP